MRCGIFFQTFGDEERLFNTPVKRRSLVALLALLATGPWWMSDYALTMACIVGIHVVATIGLNFTTGAAGLISLSHGAFVGVGCYTTAYLAQAGWPFWAAIPAGGVLACAVGIVVGIPSLRVKGLYLAVATLAAHFVLAYVFREWTAVTGGTGGVRIAPATLLGMPFDTDARKYALIMAFVVVLALAGKNLSRSYVGRAFAAIRDRDFSAEILGVNLLRTKLTAFGMGALYAGLAGGLLAYNYGGITPEYFHLSLSVFYLAAIIVGGLGTVLGSVLGAAFMTFVPEVLRLAAQALSGQAPSLGLMLLPMGQVVFGALIVFFLVFEPHGLASLWSRVRRMAHVWPFKTS